MFLLSSDGAVQPPQREPNSKPSCDMGSLITLCVAVKHLKGKILLFLPSKSKPAGNGGKDCNTALQLL